MIKKISFLLLSLITIFIFPDVALAKAETLVDAYYLALANDPTFKSQYELWLANRENAPIARANLLPQINFNGSQTRYYNNYDVFTTTPQSPVKYYDNNTSYSLNLTQPIFNFAYWAALFGAKASVKAATASFSYSTQDLIVRVAVAYFAVLQAQDILYFTQAQKKAVYEQLVQTQHKYEVGLIPITGVDEARASYDTIVANEITNKTDLENKKEQLRVITGTTSPVKFLDTLEIAVPLVRPNPTNVERWVQTAEMQNYQILAALYTAVAARENIKQQAAGHLPVINMNAGYSYSYDSNTGGGTEFSENKPGFSRYKSSNVGLSVDLPIFSGGRVTASTIQAEHSYQKAVSDEDFAHKNVASQTRQAYLNVVSGINKILANREEIKSKVSALRSTMLSYEAGLRTMVDVLNAETALYNAKKEYAISQYNYMLQTLYLKEFAGTLSPRDLEIINAWLMHSKKMPTPTPGVNDETSFEKESAKTSSEISKAAEQATTSSQETGRQETGQAATTTTTQNNQNNHTTNNASNTGSNTSGASNVGLQNQVEPQAAKQSMQQPQTTTNTANAAPQSQPQQPVQVQATTPAPAPLPQQTPANSNQSSESTQTTNPSSTQTAQLSQKTHT